MPRRIRPIRIEGNIAYVPLTQGHEAIIDAADVCLVQGWNWTALIGRNTVYAWRLGSGAIRRAVRLHRVLMGDPLGLEVDHIDGNGLNNRRANLRIATYAENTRNQRTRKDNTSGFKGVSWSKRREKWAAHIATNGKNRWLGYHDTPEAAHAAYCEASSRLHGEFGRIA